MVVNHGGSHVAMSEQFLNRAYIVVVSQEMAGITVAKGMGGGSLADPGFLHRPFDCLLHMGFMEVIAAHLAGTFFLG